MRSVSPDLRRLAQRLLAVEAASGKSAKNREPASFHVTEKLRQPLSALAGVSGFRSLLSRALSLANGEVRWLKAIHINASGSLEGLEDVRAKLSTDELAQGEAALVAHFLGLLVTFIGEALTLRLMQEVWPEISGGELNSQTENEHG